MKYSLIIVFFFMLMGCVNQHEKNALTDIDNAYTAKQAVNKATACCSELDSINIKPLQNGQYSIDSSSQVREFDSGRSFFYAGKIPTKFYGSDIYIASLIQKTAMPIQVMLLDAEKKQTRILTEEAFPFTKATLFDSYRFSSKFKLLENERYLVVFANTSNLNRFLTLPNPETLRYRAQNLIPPDYPDVHIPFSPWGTIEVKFIYSDKPISNNQNNDLYSHNEQNNAKKLEQKTPELLLSTETRKYYIAAINDSVNEHRLEHALQLVSEAKKLGFIDAENIFIEAVKKK
jgi:hypothetical protein